MDRVINKGLCVDLSVVLYFCGLYPADWAMSNYRLNMLPVYIIVAAGTLPQILATIHKLIDQRDHPLLYAQRPWS